MVRTVSALLLISFSIPIILYSPSWLFVRFVFFICSVISYEYNKLIRKIFSGISTWDVTLDVVLIIFFVCYTDYSLYFFICYLVLQISLKLFFSKSKSSIFLSLGGIFLGVVWIALPGISIIFVERMEIGRLLIISILLLFSFNTFSQDIKIGYTNVEYILSFLPETKQVQSEVQVQVQVEVEVQVQVAVQVEVQVQVRSN